MSCIIQDDMWYVPGWSVLLLDLFIIQTRLSDSHGTNMNPDIAYDHSISPTTPPTTTTGHRHVFFTCCVTSSTAKFAPFAFFSPFSFSDMVASWLQKMFPMIWLFFSSVVSILHLSWFGHVIHLEVFCPITHSDRMPNCQYPLLLCRT